jgi:hypothetical protein
MVTMPSEAATDPAIVTAARAGDGVMRELRATARRVDSDDRGPAARGRNHGQVCRVVDLAGPKLHF